jgi:endonuclease YncB( thermonuclease family)
VAGVSDGDSLTVRAGMKKDRIRLCGIDAPEKDQPFGNESRDKLRSLIVGAGNQVIVTPVERDRYGRLVAEVFIKAPTPQQPEQEKLVNYEMVTAGLAYHYARYSDSCLNQQSLIDGEAQAKRLRRGVWSNPNLVKPWD